MPARTPEDLDRLFAQALNTGNVDALVALYEPGASLTASPGSTVHGHAAIREALARFVAGRPNITLAPRLLAQADDLALVTSRWELTTTGPHGEPVNVAGESIEVARRQPGGEWLFALDEPFGLVRPA
jgi:ketosteroid isomerase-like protein